MELRARDNAPTAWLGPSLQKAADTHCRDPGKQMTFMERPFSSCVQGRPGLIQLLESLGGPTPPLCRGQKCPLDNQLLPCPSLLPLRPLSLQWRDSGDPARRVKTQETGSCDRQGWYRLGGQAPKCFSLVRAVVLALARPPEPQPRPDASPAALLPGAMAGFGETPVCAQACPSPQHLLPRPPAALIAGLPET